MKRLVLILSLLSVVLCGCTNADTQLTINKDKSASIAVELKSDGNLNDNSPESLTVMQNYQKFLDDKYNVDNGDLTVIKAVKSVKNIEKEDLDLSSLGFVTNFPDSKYVAVKKNFFVTSYNIDMNINVAKEALKVEPVTPESLSDGGLKPEYIGYADKDTLASAVSQSSDRADFAANYENNLNIVPQKESTVQEAKPDYNYADFNAVFSIKVPSFASYNNADSSENNVYYWNIKKDAPTVIRFQYVVYSGFAITFIILLGIGLLVYIARRIVRHENLKRIGNKG